MSIQDFNSSSYWYKLSRNNDGSLCKLLLLYRSVFFIFILLKCEFICQEVVSGDMTTIIAYIKWKLFIVEYELVNIEINKSKVDVLVRNKLVRRDVYFIQIGNTHYHSHFKSSKQYSTGHLHPVINTCHISRIFLEFKTIDISDYIYSNDCINNDSLKRNVVHTSNIKNNPTSMIKIIDN